MSEVSTNAPVASKFVFLHEIASLSAGAKVRFLGCVVDYDVAKGRLLLEHAYPKQARPTPRVCVDVNLILESVHPLALSRGSWINIIGYTQETSLQNRKKSEQLQPRKDEVVLVQAILIWNAGSLRIEDYEITIEDQRAAQRQLRTISK